MKKLHVEFNPGDETNEETGEPGSKHEVGVTPSVEAGGPAPGISLGGVLP